MNWIKLGRPAKTIRSEIRCATMRKYDLSVYLADLILLAFLLWQFSHFKSCDKSTKDIPDGLQHSDSITPASFDDMSLCFLPPESL